MKPGKVEIGTPNDLSLVDVTQGEDYLYGKINISSNKQYSTVFKDGYIESSRGSKRWINGTVCLIEKDNLLWLKDFERPVNASVSNDGKVAILFSKYKDYSTHSGDKPELESTLVVMEKSGQRIFDYHFDANTLACTISHDGTFVSVATFNPDNSVYCFNTNLKKILWKYKNHHRNVITDLRFNENEIEVFCGKTMITQQREYALNLDGTLTDAYAMEKKIRDDAREQPAERKAESLLTMVKSHEKRDILHGLSELKSFIYTKESKPHYDAIIECMKNHIGTKDEEIFAHVKEIIRVLLRKQPRKLETIIPDFLSIIRQNGDAQVEGNLMFLGEVGHANPKWISSEIPYIMKKLVSKRWNERRFASFAIGSIGAVDVNAVKDAIPILIEYVSNLDKIRSELEQLAKTDRVVAIDLMTSSGLGADPATWLRDACVDSLGEIGKKFPEAVKDVVPLLQRLSKDAPSPYTMKKAKAALEKMQKGK